MIREAIILAAGRGCRFGKRTEEMPKGFLELGGEPIVETSVRNLLAHGIEKIIIGTGHCRSWYEKLAQRYPEIVTVVNQNYAQTGSMGTLEVCAAEISGDFLLLESDLVYDPEGIRILLDAPERDLILASGRTGSGDEVYLETDEKRALTGISKNPAVLRNIFAELVGITRLRRETLMEMCAFAASHHAEQPQMEYETALCHASKLNPVAIRKIEFFLWCEIDDEHHLERAQNLIFPRVAEKCRNEMIRREILLNPGPATTTDSVKRAQIVPDICPREREFGELMRWVGQELVALTRAPDEYETVLFSGSGTAADEAMLGSCVPPDGKLLVIDNGAYGARMAEMAGVYHIKHGIMRRSAYAALDPAEVEAELKRGRYTHLAMVWHETTTGLLNPLVEIGAICRRLGVVTMIDGVSGFAGIPLNFRESGIDFMATVSNKNLQSMPGIAIVFCRCAALERLREIPKRCYYLDLYEQALYFRKHDQSRFTPPVQTIYALRQAILELKHETLEGRVRRYQACGELLERGVEAAGLTLPVPREVRSRLITAIREPELPGYKFAVMHDWLRKRGFTIYPGKTGELNTFRIANIGDIRPDEIKRFTALLQTFLTVHV